VQQRTPIGTARQSVREDVVHDEQVTAPDSTAVRVALWRALHLEVDSPPHVFEDEVGLKLAAPDDGWRSRPDMSPFTRPFRAGNAARGRVVFAKLQCFDCHVVRGDQFAAPTRPGPDLTGIGRRHPGYLVESIMNPDAMVVDGPRYTDARGLSTMPDYGQRLTVSDLVDLVAYLKGLTDESSPPRDSASTLPSR
jgi:mono/diheme cytochrome c family protein